MYYVYAPPSYSTERSLAHGSGKAVHYASHHIPNTLDLSYNHVQNTYHILRKSRVAMEDTTIHANDPSSLLNLTGASSSDVSPLEQEVLDEYERLLKNMNTVLTSRSLLTLLDFSQSQYLTTCQL